MNLILPNRMPSKQWIERAVFGYYEGFGKVAIVVDDSDKDNVLVVVGCPDHANPQGAIPVSRFLISGETMASRDEIERLVHKAAKKASRSLAGQIAAERAKLH